MGHTIPPFTWQFRIEKDYFGKFRRALLLVEDKRIFDDLWNKAEFHITAAEKTSHPLPIATVLMMMNLEQQKMIQQLEYRAKTQAEKIKSLEQVLKKSEAQLANLMLELEESETQVKERLRAFREEMLSIKYSEHEYGS